MTFPEGWLKRQMERASQEMAQWPEEKKSLIPAQEDEKMSCQDGDEAVQKPAYT